MSLHFFFICDLLAVVNTENYLSAISSADNTVTLMLGQALVFKLCSCDGVQGFCHIITIQSNYFTLLWDL